MAHHNDDVTHPDDPSANEGATGSAQGEGCAGPVQLAGLIESVDHIGLAVADLEAAIAFHTEVLGLELRHREENSEQGVAEAMLAPVGARPGAAEIQLLAPIRDDSAIARFLARSGPGIQQLAYRVGDVEQVSAELRRRGLRLLYPQARGGTRGSKINFVHPRDTGGVLIELVEHLDSR